MSHYSILASLVTPLTSNKSHKIINDTNLYPEISKQDGTVINYLSPYLLGLEIMTYSPIF